ncbi:MAG: hypothetical protein IPM66_09100 [Acidobacteriota bacterium]|nr:MAG: hypothetical protein IPM66_09100 [Acidobacteriota bacterium]
MIQRPLRILLLAAIVVSGLRIGVSIIRQAEAALLVQFGADEADRRRAAELAPGNPRAVAALGKYLLYRAVPPSPEESILELRRAAGLSPRDYRFWLELGRGYENTGRTEGAELALRRAVELAPRYFEPQWALANFQLRAGRIEPALAAFRRAIELSGGSTGRIDQRVANNAFAAVSGALGINLEALGRVAPEDPVSKAALAVFLARNDALDQALDMWRRNSGQDPPSYRALTLQLLRELESRGRFEEAGQVWSGLAALLNDRAIHDARSGNLMYNAGFETVPLDREAPELLDPPAGFDWILSRHPEVVWRRQYAVRHRGSYSLHLQFPASMQSDFDGAWQKAAVTGGRRYRLTFFVKNRYVPLAPSEIPYVEIRDVVRPDLFRLRAPVPPGTNDWREQSLVFTVPPETTGLRIGIRAPRLKTIDRTKITELWFDDFSLVPLPDEAFFHFPFSIYHFSFAIVKTGFTDNDEC